MAIRSFDRNFIVKDDKAFNWSYAVGVNK
jgi:hypothetical protein